MCLFVFILWHIFDEWNEEKTICNDRWKIICHVFCFDNNFVLFLPMGKLLKTGNIRFRFWYYIYIFYSEIFTFGPEPPPVFAVGVSAGFVVQLLSECFPCSGDFGGTVLVTKCVFVCVIKYTIECNSKLNSWSSRTSATKIFSTVICFHV